MSASDRGRSNRRKGQAGERELLNMLGELIGQDLARNLVQNRGGGSDNEQTPYALEIKRQQQAKPHEWWQQAVEQADEADKIPALAYRANRQPWRVIVPLQGIAPSHADGYDWQWTAAISVPAFAEQIRELMEDYA